MAIVVQKYGGSSVADVAKLRRVAQNVVERSRSGDSMVVVVSAMGKTTDQLIALAHDASPNPHRRELDMLVTAGERISMALLSMLVHDAGVEAISFTGSQSGIITEDSHQGARIVEVRPQRINDAIERGQVVIVAGYQGVSVRREVTTLGRGGSDTTAVALAAALGAEACEIYSDVDGVYSADPRVCPQAQLLPELDYQTMQAMSGAGAKVLNAEAVEFARRAGITIVARKTGGSAERRTVIRARPESIEFGKYGVAAVVGASDVVRLRGKRSATTEQTHECSHATEVCSVLDARDAIVAAGGRVLAVTSGGRDFDILVRTGEMAAAAKQCLHGERLPAPVYDSDTRAASELENMLTGPSPRLRVSHGAAVTVTGAGLLSNPAVLTVLDQAERAQHEVIAWSGSEISMTGFVQAEACDAWVARLHTAFCLD